jgi:peroxiredoxin
MTQVNAGRTAPGFSLQGLDGKNYSLEELLRGGPVLAAFFKISCPVCQFTFPFLQRLHERYGSNDVIILGISQDDAKATASFAKQYGITFPIALDQKEKGYLASNAYGLTSVPTIFLIDPEGAVRVSSMGFVKKDLEQIAANLSERRKIAPAALFRTNETVPENRPG